MNEEKWQDAQRHMVALKSEIAQVIVGQQEIIEQMLVALLCRGHCLMIGVPGLAKTLLVSTLGKVLGLNFHRIQFTPDLMPTDIVGTEILQEDPETGHRRFQFVHGPVFTNLLLADEINRTPPKTQAALLEAMQELQATVNGETFPMPEPFMVFATQNPIEHEGTYPLPEAQLDRFFLSLHIDYPQPDEERQIVLQTTRSEKPAAKCVLHADDLSKLQQAVFDIPVPDHVIDYVMRLVQATRPGSEAPPEVTRRYVSWGAGPRASQTFVLAAKGLALLRGRTAVSVEEVQELALPVLRHRIIPNYTATGEGVSVDQMITQLVDHVPVTS